MSPRGRILFLMSVMAAVVTIVVAVALGILSTWEFRHEREILKEVARAQSMIIESTLDPELLHAETVEAEAEREEVIDHVRDAYRNHQGFLDTGQFVIGRREADSIEILASTRSHEDHLLIPIDSEEGETLKLALDGQEGVDVLVDHRGVEVLAAFRPLRGFNLAIVAQIDMAEIRKPLIQTGILTSLIAALLVALGTFVFMAVTNPLIHGLETLNRDLEASNALTQGILETAAEGIVTTDANGVIESFNRAAERIWGYTREEAIGRNVSLLMPSPHRENHDGYIKRYMETGEARIIGFVRELTGVRKDGTEFPVDLAISHIDAGGVVRFTGIARDITGRKQAEADRQKYVSLIENSGDFIAMTDLEGNFQYLNAAAREMIGIQQIESAGAPAPTRLEEILPASDAEIVRKNMIPDALSYGQWMGVTRVRNLATDGLIDVFINIFVVRDARTGEPLCLATVTKDITDLKRAESAERERAAAELANRAKSSFLANMSHELRTPMNAIIGYSEMLQEDALDAGLNEYVEDLKKIHSAGKHLLSLINDILDLSKIEAGRMDVYLEEVDVRTLVGEVIATIEPLAQKNSNALSVECPEDAGRINTDVTKLRQTLFNLLSNACKFTENGKITLSVKAVEEGGRPFYHFAVADSGIGISDEQIERLFEPFTQADASTTRKYGGTGLGLAITKRFCEMMGGSVHVVSEPGVGSTFHVRLPADGAAPVKIEEIPRRHPAEWAKPEGEGPLVLVVDDDPAARELISRTLIKEGYQVTTAASGEEGLEAARRIKPAAVTLDVMMPHMDGWAVLKELKSDSSLADVPVVMITIINEQQLGFALGAAEYLTKPVDRDSLIRAVKRFRCDLPPCPVLVIDDDPEIRSLLGRVLTKEGWTVREAANGREGLEQLQAHRPNVILLDLMMPEMDGFEFLLELRKSEERRSIPVIVLTAKDLTDEERRMLQGNVERVLQKGAYSRDELIEEIRDLVGGGRTRT